MDTNNYCVSVALETAYDATSFTSFVNKSTGSFDVCFVKHDDEDINMDMRYGSLSL